MVISIIIGIFAVLIVALVIGFNIYKRIKGEDTGECSSCNKNMKKNLKKVRDELEEEKCSCNKNSN